MAATKKQKIECPWNAEMEESLIEKVHKITHLWDIKDPYYKARNYKRHGFSEIAAVMKNEFPHVAHLITDTELMDKFRRLRNYYFRKVRESRYLKSGSEGTGFIPPWIHFKRMQFLRDMTEGEESVCSVILPKNNTLESDRSTNTENVEIEVEIQSDRDPGDGAIAFSPLEESFSSVLTELSIPPSEENCIPPDSPCQSNSSQRPTPSQAIPPKKEKMKKVNKMNEKQKKINDVLNEAKILMENINKSDDDVDEAFGHFIALRLKQIKNETMKDRARLEIQEVLLKYSSANIE